MIGYTFFSIYLIYEIYQYMLQIAL